MFFVREWKKNYYMAGVDQRPWADLGKRLLWRRAPSFPSTVQLQTHTGCNAGCIFCPYEDSHTKVPKGRMSEELFKKIVAELGQYHTRRISPYLMNEPFLNPRLLEQARYIRDRVRGARLKVTTNGGLLGEATVDDLVKDNPFRAIFVSVQGIEKGPYEATMRGRMNFEETKANVEYLIEQRDKHAPGLKIIVTMVKTKKIDAEAAVAYWRSKGVESKYTVLENRGGNNEAFDALNAGGKKVFKDCTRLFKQAYILFNGDMVLCCTDYYQTMILGNVGESSIYEVWNSERAKKIRRDFLKGDLSENPLCANCYVSNLEK